MSAATASASPSSAKPREAGGLGTRRPAPALNIDAGPNRPLSAGRGRLARVGRATESRVPRSPPHPIGERQRTFVHIDGTHADRS
jgi:hypothetical protein